MADPQATSRPDDAGSAPLQSRAAESVAPRAPNDDLTFEQLQAQYNFRKTSTRGRVVTRLIIKACQDRANPVRVLDIGCGKGIERSVDYQWAIRPHAQEYWGLEPDPSIETAPGLFDRCERTILQDADLPPNSIDIAYSFMVMEHVSDPDGFMAKVHHCLKPGGEYIFVTPNRRHYFTRIAAGLNRLGLDELVLRMVRRKLVDEYHYPVQYRFNDERQINACAAKFGFEPPKYLYMESVGPIGYFPGPLKAIFHLLAAKRKVIQQPKSLITMVGRIRKKKPTG